MLSDPVHLRKSATVAIGNKHDGNPEKPLWAGTGETVAVREQGVVGEGAPGAGRAGA